MATELLATRIRIPPPVPSLVPRPRLTGAIERAIPFARLVLVSAPAGYGKTTLIAQWARTSTLPVAWLNADLTDNDHDSFLRSLLRALETIWPDVRDTDFGIQVDSADPVRDRTLVALVNTASARQDHLALVIDDLHLISSPDVLATLDSLLDHLPPTVHLVIGTRTAPPLSLARRRARGELLELRARDLEFEQSEALAFLTAGMGLALDDDDALTLRNQVEGWAAGLQLAALRLRRDPTQDVAEVATGNQRDIVDYLSEEVVSGLPDEMRAFLLRSSILDRLNASLCQAVTGIERSQETLERLERANLFVMPLDDSRTWYRYQRVFAVVLRRWLADQGDDLAELHRRAARWLLDNDLPDEAFQHALEADDIDLVCELFERHVEARLFGGEMRVVENWLAALPEHWRTSRSEIVLAQASFLVLTGQLDAARANLAILERLPGVDPQQARQSVARGEAIRCFIACFRNDLPEAIDHAARAFRQLPHEDLSYRANIHHALGDTYRSHQRWDDARDNYRRVLDIVAQTPGDTRVRAIRVHSYGALADLELRQGHLRAAAANWARALQVIQDDDNWRHFTLPVTGWIHLRLAELAYEWNNLDRARDDLRRGLERANLGGEPRSMIAGRAIAARVALTDDDLLAAGVFLDEASAMLERTTIPDWADRIDRGRVELLLAQGRQRTALEWAFKSLATSDSTGVLHGEDVQLAIARVFVDAGSAEMRQRGVILLDQLVDLSGRMGLDVIRLEALALRAIAHNLAGSPAAGLTDLEAALVIGEAEGYVRRFVDLGLSMQQLLREADRRQVMPEYVGSLLEAFGDARPGPGHSLAEPLTVRETEVLRLLAAGLSNREIAEQLFVSPETVKKHTTSIYAKLGVRGRVEAVTRARSIALID